MIDKFASDKFVNFHLTKNIFKLVCDAPLNGAYILVLFFFVLVIPTSISNTATHNHFQRMLQVLPTTVFFNSRIPHTDELTHKVAVWV